MSDEPDENKLVIVRLTLRQHRLIWAAASGTAMVQPREIRLEIIEAIEAFNRYEEDGESA